jgi:chromate transporter
LTAPPRRVSPLDLVLVFVWLSVTTYGGAQSAAIRRAIVRDRGWISEAEYLEFRGIATLAPGPNSPNLAILIGHRLAGTPGALVAFLAATVPGALIVLLLGLVALDPHFRALLPALRGAAAVAVGLTLANALEMTLPYRTRIAPLAIVAATAVAASVFHLSLWLTLLIFLPLSILAAKPPTST